MTKKTVLALAGLLVLMTALAPVRASAETSLIPLPVYATSRNGGNDYGIMPVWLLKEDEYVYGIFAPSVIYNDNTGVNLTLRYLGYPTVDKSYRLFLNRSIGVDHELTGEYWDNKHMDGRLRVFGRASYFRDSTYRFFGTGPRTREEDETNYSNVEFTPEASVGYYLPGNFIVSVREKFRLVTIRPGSLDKLPNAQDNFADLPGMNGGAVMKSRVTLTYDTRDDEVYPGSGWLANVYGEADVSFTGSRFYSKGGLDARKYISFDDKRFITVIKGAIEVTGGHDVPFFERSYIGGENSMRGYGTFRFTDDGYIVLNIEERIRLFRANMFGVWSDFEAAPFVDMGRVYGSFGSGFFKGYKVNPGVGFRAIVEPNVVGRVDLGMSDEGLTAFVGLDFPF